MELLGVLTGVAIHEVGDPSVIAFSCYPQEKDNGGVGLIKLSGNMRDKEVIPVKSNNKAMLAGSILHVNTIPDSCSFDPVPKICSPEPPMEVKFPEPTTTMKNNVQNDKNNEVGGGKSEETKSASGKDSANSLVPKYSLVSSLVIFSILFKKYILVQL